MGQLAKCSLGLMFHFPGFHLEKLFFVCSGFLPLFLFLDEKKKFAKRKIKASSVRAKTPALKMNGNELAALKQISVLTAFALVFLNACSAEANLTFSGCLLRFAGKGAFLFGLACGIAFFFQINFYKSINKV